MQLGIRAHAALDREVARLYGYAKDTPEPEIIAGLMRRYARLAEGAGPGDPPRQ